MLFRLVPLPYVLTLAASLLATGCGALAINTKSGLTIGMLGTFTTPPKATGNNLPKTETFQLIAATLTRSDGTVITAYEGAPEPFHILNRAQIILQYDLSSEVGTAIKSIDLQFNPAVTATGKYNGAMTATLDQATVSYAVPFTVVKAKNLRLDIGVDWQNTVQRDDSAKTETLQAPVLEIALGDDANS